jgi:hypothetical protein
MKKISLCLVFLIYCQFGFAQQALDSTKINKDYKFNYKQLIIPTALMTYGVIGLESDGLKLVNSNIRAEVMEDIDKKITIDDFSQYAPAAAVYGLNLAGIHGKNNFKDRTLILGTSYLIMATTVTSLKHIAKVERPDGSAFNSFPSGHTGTAFVGAEFMWQEYKDESIWYGISGYIVATGTGVFRIYNNKHWLTDVAMGAGIGILSTKTAYWLFPIINEKIFKSKNKNKSALAIPFYNGKQAGLAYSIQF